LLRLFPALAFVVLSGPVAAGLAGILLPAAGYLPVLGHRELSAKPLLGLLAMPGLARSAALSFGTGLAATAIAFTVVMLFVAGWHGTRLFAVLQRLVSPLLSVPHAAAAFGLTFLIAPSGLLFRLVSPWATGFVRPPDLLVVNDRLGITMTLGLVVKEIPFLLLMTLAALPQARAGEMARVAAALGYGRILGFLHGAMPAVYRQIRLAVLAVIAFSTSVVDLALVLGPTTPPPLAVRIVAWQRNPDLGELLVAAAGALLQLAVTAAALLVWFGLERLGAHLRARLARSGWRGATDAWARLLGAAMMALAAGTVLAGIAVLALWSVAGAWRFPALLPETLRLDAWMRLPGMLDLAFRNTLAIAAASSLTAVVLALGALEFNARRGRAAHAGALAALYLPLLVPQVAFLFGLQILAAFAGVDGTFAAVALVHLVFVFPYVLLSLAEPWQSWDPRYGHALRALGRSENAVFWRARLPMLTRPVLTASALGFAVSVGLYLPTLMIGAGRWPTVTTETVALASGGDPRVVGATALAQALLPFLGFAVAAFLPTLAFRRRRLLQGTAR
jgi:putative thiamine transport system permease protein